MNMEEGRRWGHNALLLSETAHKAWSWIENAAHGHYMKQQGSFSRSGLDSALVFVCAPLLGMLDKNV